MSCGSTGVMYSWQSFVSQTDDQNSHASSATVSSSSTVACSMYCTTAPMCGRSFSMSASRSITSALHTQRRTPGEMSVARAKRPWRYASMWALSGCGMSGTNWLMHAIAYRRNGGELCPKNCKNLGMRKWSGCEALLASASLSGESSQILLSAESAPSRTSSSALSTSGTATAQASATRPTRPCRLRS